VEGNESRELEKEIVKAKTEYAEKSKKLYEKMVNTGN